MQAFVKFFTQRLINQALTRDAGEPRERIRHEAKAVVRLTARMRAGVTGMARGLVVKLAHDWRKLFSQHFLYAFGA